MDTAAAYCSMLYLGITLGRVLSGALTVKVSDRNLIRWGILIALAGVVLIIAPVSGIFSAVGLFVVGFGASLVFPSILHLTPVQYGEKYSATVIGLEMSAAYVGAACMPLVSGFILEQIGMQFVPYVLLLLFVLMLIATELASRQKSIPGMDFRDSDFHGKQFSCKPTVCTGCMAWHNQVTVLDCGILGVTEPITA